WAARPLAPVATTWYCPAAAVVSLATTALIAPSASAVTVAGGKRPRGLEAIVTPSPGENAAPERRRIVRWPARARGGVPAPPAGAWPGESDSVAPPRMVSVTGTVRGLLTVPAGPLTVTDPW